MRMRLLLFAFNVCTFVAASSLYDAAPADAAAVDEVKLDRTVERGLDWLAARQSTQGHWTANDGNYPTAMTALAGMAFLCEGSTTTQGKYAKNIRLAVDYLTSRSRRNGLIGDPSSDDRYTYGHGYSMMFLSQVLGEEEDVERREELIEVLTKAVRFTGEAQTDAGGWGYVSAKDGSNFDEGSTTITQVQGLRGCRNAGIPVPDKIIDKAVEYIRKCTLPDGGVQYSSQGGGGRPAITAAAIACLYNAGEYDERIRPQTARLLRKEPQQHSERRLRPLALRPLLLRASLLSRRRQSVGRLPREDLRADVTPVKPRRTAPGTKAISAPSTRRRST